MKNLARSSWTGYEEAEKEEAMTITIKDHDAALLSTLLRRLTFEDVRRRAADERECYAMLEAVERCRSAMDGGES